MQEQLHQRIAELETALREIQNSTSWKITAPLREFSRWTRGNFPLRRFPLRYLFQKIGKDGLWKTLRTVVNSLRYQGLNHTLLHIRNHFAHHGNYQEWIAKYDTLTDLDRAAIARHIAALPYHPLISVVLPVYNVAPEFLKQAIDSVRSQLYPHWELCIADDCSTNPEIRRLLESCAAEPRIKLVFREQNGHISAASNSALALASGDYIALLDHDDTLSEHALYHVAVAINANPDADLFYSDEDKLAPSGRRQNPYFKSDWNPELFLGHNMFSHLGVYRRSLVETIGGFREGYEGSQDYDICLRALTECGHDKVVHIPYILYHWRVIPESTAASMGSKPYAVEAAARAKRDYLQGINPEALVKEIPGLYQHRVIWPVPNPAPSVEIIIPTRDGYALVKQCIESLQHHTEYPNYHITIVDNGSSDPEMLAYLRTLEKESRIGILPYPAPFNFSAINNAAVAHTQSDLLLFLNNDTEVMHAGWLGEMVSQAMRPEIGAVGAKLLYSNHTVQHCGIITGVGTCADPIAGHAFQYAPGSDQGYFGRAVLTHNVSAVTGACLMMRRAVFEEVGRFNETDLAVAFNDVDLCLKVRQAGYRIICTPFAMLFHHESVSRGLEDTPEKLARFVKEQDYMRSHWGEVLDNDPYYNPNLDYLQGDFCPAFPPRQTPPWKNPADWPTADADTKPAMPDAMPLKAAGSR